MELSSITDFLARFIPRELLSEVYLGNTMEDYIIAIAAFVAAAVAFKFIQWVVLLRLEQFAKKTKTDIDDTVIRIIRSLRPQFYYFLAFYIAIQFLSLSQIFDQIVTAILVIWVVYQVIIGLQILIDDVIAKRFVKDKDPGTKSAVKYLSNISKFGLWAVGLLLILSNLGINITSLVAGLGIGGLAIAFALQNILSDLFSSFAIFFDKPFQIGDFITAGSHSGTVEKIGIKTTRLRALSGEEIVIGNKELTSARIQNYRTVKEWRVVLSLGVLYETPHEKLEKIPSLVEGAVKQVPKARFDRAHFSGFGDSALLFEVVYYAETGNYTEYMDIKQGANLGIAQAFGKEQIGFAYPTQTLYINKS
ncbi:MAG: mechanosensitive ion channel family protein [Candidatus Paceibacterota bacterium]